MIIYITICLISLAVGWFCGLLQAAPSGWQDKEGFHLGSEYQQNRIKGLEDSLWEKERDLNVAEIQLKKLERVISLKNVIINQYVEERANLLDRIAVAEGKEGK